MHFVCIGTDRLSVTRRPMDSHSTPIIVEGLRALRLHWFRSSAVPRNRMVIGITPRNYACLQSSRSRNERILRIDGVLRSYDAVGGDRMTPRMITKGTAR